MRIAIGSDHRGCAIRPRVVDLVDRLGHDVLDLGTEECGPVDYPDIAGAVGSHDRDGAHSWRVGRFNHGLGEIL